MQAGTPVDVEPKYPPAYVVDTVFQTIMEEWVYQASKERVWRWKQVFNDDDAELLERMDCNHYACRKAVQRDLSKITDRSRLVKLAVWGRHAKSGEIKYICAPIIPKMFVCNNCQGEGELMQKGQYSDYSWMQRCKECGGTGDYLTIKVMELFGETSETDRQIIAPALKK
jgi:hypothetical protein